MRDLLGNKRQLIGVAPRDGPIRHFACSGLLLVHVPPATECFPQDGVVRLLGHLRTAASVKGRKEPTNGLHYPITGITEIGDPEIIRNAQLCVKHGYAR